MEDQSKKAVKLTGRSHQKRLERPRRPAAIHFQCKLAPMSGRLCELHELLERRELRKLREAQLYANEQRRDTADLDSEAGKKAEKGRARETYYCRNRCIDGLLNMPAI